MARPTGDISIEPDKRTLKRIERALKDVPRGFPAAMSRAINDTARAVKTRMVSGIFERFNIGRRKVAEQLEINPRARRSRLWAKVRLSKTHRFSLKEFAGRQTRKGITYQIERGGTRELVPSGFIVQKFGGHPFIREGAARLPIVKLHGLSPWGMYTRTGMEESDTRPFARITLRKTMEARMEGVLHRFRTKGKA